jgi:hypothetical protein
MSSTIKLGFFTILFLFFACRPTPENKKKKILAADREAPIGWVILSIYEDSTFEYTSSGARNPTEYSGYVHIKNDTIFFNYKDSIPAVGNKAVIENNYIVYIAGAYREHVEIKTNELK